MQNPARDSGEYSHPLSRALAAVQQAEELRLAGKLDRAQSVCAAVLKQYPDYVAALQTMGLILADRSQDEQALAYLHRASILNPKDPMILTALSGVYLSVGANLAAARTLEQARQLAPNDVNVLATLGEIYRAEKDYELAKEAFEAALKIDPSFSTAEVGLALSLVQIGQLADAAEIFQRKIRQGSLSISLLYVLGQLPASLVDVDLISLLEEVGATAGKQGTLNDEFRTQLAFAKAAAFDKAGRYDEAWAQLREARHFRLVENRRHYQEARQAHGPMLRLVRSGQVTLPSEDAASEYPISLFIVGPSRSGKTSLERLVGTLAGVKRGYENPIVENAVRFSFQAAGFPTRDMLNELPPALGELFRASYSEELRKRAGPARVLTNTLPARNEDALRAASEIPNSRFIFMKRDIDDISLRIFMRHYKSGHVHASDLRDIRDYVSFCHHMIDAMAERMPAISLVATYEEMVIDPSTTLARAAELCGLEISGATLPSIGDDRGCAAPYRDRIEAALHGDE